MHSSFNFYLSNQYSNKKVPKKSCRSRNFEQLWYSIVFHLRPCRRRKIEFSNWSFELCFNYEIAPPPSPFSVSRSRRCRLAAGTATRRALAAFPVSGSPEASRPLHAAPSPYAHAEDGRRRATATNTPSRAVCRFAARRETSVLPLLRHNSAPR